jgi:hypothetical protein
MATPITWGPQALPCPHVRPQTANPEPARGEPHAWILQRNPRQNRATPELVARAYGEYLWSSRHGHLVKEKKISRSRFYVGLSVDNTGLEELTKRVVLISDTLLISHDEHAEFRKLSLNKAEVHKASLAPRYDGQIPEPEFFFSMPSYGMYCPDLHALGQWILDAEPLMRAGLAWYLPNYATQLEHSLPAGHSADEAASTGVIDYLVKDGAGHRRFWGRSDQESARAAHSAH